MKTKSLNNVKTSFFYISAKRTLEILFCVVFSPYLVIVFISFFLRKIIKNENIFISQCFYNSKNKELKLKKFNTLNIYVKNSSMIYYIFKGDISLVGTAMVPFDEITQEYNSGEIGFFSLWFLRSNSKMINVTVQNCNDEYLRNQSLQGDLKILIKSLIVLLYYSEERRFEKKVKLLGIEFDNLRIKDILKNITKRITSNEKQSIFFINADCLNKAYENAQYQELLQKADMVLPDGSGINMGCNMIHTPLKENLNGTDMLPFICKLSAKKDFSIYLLGAKDGIANDMKNNLHKMYPNLNIVGTHHGYINDTSLTQEVINDINEKQPDILFVAMGAPYQEIFIETYRDQIDAKIFLGVGGLFDFYSNKIKRAPLFVREIGFEWIYRMLQEPKRMWKRYIIGNPKFLYRIFKYKKHEDKNVLINRYLSRYDKPKEYRINVVLWKLSLKLKSIFKRLIDIVASIILLLLFIPLFMTVALIIRYESKGAVLFTQTRVGKNGKLFKMYKFRSMVQNAEDLKKELSLENESKDGVIFKIKDDPRITKFGRFIRKSSIDELPQLLNVLKGDMSLVGPRPPVLSEVVQYNLDDRKRLDMKPGITCIWQVSGRSQIPFKQQVQMDKEYIKNQSFFTDIKLLLKTIPAVLFSKGAC